MGILVGNQWIKAILGLVLTGILVSVLSMVGVVKGEDRFKKSPNPLLHGFTLFLIF